MVNSSNLHNNLDLLQLLNLHHNSNSDLPLNLLNNSDLPLNRHPLLNFKVSSQYKQLLVLHSNKVHKDCGFLSQNHLLQENQNLNLFNNLDLHLNLLNNLDLLLNQLNNLDLLLNLLNNLDLHLNLLNNLDLLFNQPLGLVNNSDLLLDLLDQHLETTCMILQVTTS